MPDREPQRDAALGIRDLEGGSSAQASGLRALALYLPQYHPIPENDRWWGRGFTDWTNVTQAKPRFPSHYQPHLPADLGFVDLRVPEAREAQADLARAYGIHGFCYYHYWFHGHRLLERPFDEVLSTRRPDFPFCLCWANEPWSRRWDGSDQEVLIDQHYSRSDDQAHIRSLFSAFEDARYIRIHGRPLFILYRTELLPEPRRTVDVWREACLSAGIGDLYLVRCENFTNGVDPASIGFDAAVEFAPDFRVAGPPINRGSGEPAFLTNNVHDYETIVENMLRLPSPPFNRFRAVFPSWDNTSRRPSSYATIFVNSSPAKYRRWLELTALETVAQFDREERLVFINAWNEWGEGCHLEPDQKHGLAFLEATRDALMPYR